MTCAVGRKRGRTGLVIVELVQWSSIGIAIRLLNVTKHVAWILPCVILIVGLHLLPLAAIFGYSGYHATAAERLNCLR